MDPAPLRTGEGPRSEEPELAARFAELARALFATHSVQATLQAIVDLATDTIEGCDGAAVLLITRNEIVAGSWTNDIVRRVEAAEYTLGEGPCVDAIWTAPTFESADLRDHLTQWPKFVAIALEEGIAGILAFRLFVAEDTLGALDLYSYTAGAFDDSTRAVGMIFAAHASLALAGAEIHAEDLAQLATLREALATRDVIGQAKGMLMAIRHIGADEAFDLLRRTSQDENVKLHEVARRVAELGDLAAP